MGHFQVREVLVYWRVTHQQVDGRHLSDRSHLAKDGAVLGANPHDRCNGSLRRPMADI